ncbi:MAG: hypothetical protein ABIP75_15835 [Pyrinomonadaceae bacterium]
MKHCPACNRDYSDDTLSFCLDDGSPLTFVASGSTPAYDPNATLTFNTARPTDPMAPSGFNQSGYSQPPPNPTWDDRAGSFAPKPKSKAIWWVLGIGVVLLAGAGVISLVAVIGIATLSNSNQNKNSTTNKNSANSNQSNQNENKEPIDTVKDDGRKLALTDDFAEQKWTVNSGEFGNSSYVAGMYQLVGVPDRYFVTYAPSDDYLTDKNTTVKVTTRSVTGSSTNFGYGVAVNGSVNNGNANDYAFLIVTGETPQFTVVMHRNGQTTTVKEWTRSSLIRTGTTPNQLEVKLTSEQLSFYVNGQFATSITNTGELPGGRVGLCVHDTYPIAFDDLQIYR